MSNSPPWWWVVAHFSLIMNNQAFPLRAPHPPGPVRPHRPRQNRTRPARRRPWAS